ncbi:MAG: hypothetical protein JXR95_10760 [Deltaproteobacteria bacterium]|nr:hypothetical protein [Deltaproteobacteria bacterium]
MAENPYPHHSLKKNINLNAILWLIPVVAIILVLILTIFGGRYRKSNTELDIPGKMVKASIDVLLNPLKLTAGHFESLSPVSTVPPETVKRHFELLKKIAPFKSLLVMDEERTEIACAGSRDEMEKIKLIPFLKDVSHSHVTAVLKAGKISGLLFSVPMNSVEGKKLWLMAQIDVSAVESRLPSSIHLKSSENPLKKPFHPEALKLYIETDVVNRPIWPLLLGELMLGFGIFILILTLKSRKN